MIEGLEEKWISFTSLFADKVQETDWWLYK